jgi:hypothetical protein
VDAMAAWVVMGVMSGQVFLHGLGCHVALDAEGSIRIRKPLGTGSHIHCISGPSISQSNIVSTYIQSLIDI